MSNETTEANLREMEKAELVTYANMTFGLNVNGRMNKEDIIGSIMRASQKYRGNAQIDVSSSALKPGFAKIRINKTELNKSGRPVIVGLQGTMYSLPVGVDFQCPLPLVEILNNAVQRQYEVDPGNNELIPREVHSYPFVVLETRPLDK